MAKKTMTPSTTGPQIDKAVANYRAMLEKFAPQFPADAVQKVLGQSELADEQFKVFRRRIEALLVLAPRGSEEIILAERHDPDVFFQTRSGLWVGNDFHSRIVANARPSDAGTTLKVNSAEFTRDLTDKEIEEALPKEHLFDETMVCAVIADLIAKQPNGENGTLINNGRANLFYTESYVVLVRWSADYRRWYVSAWWRGAYRWYAGRLAFSPATETR